MAILWSSRLNMQNYLDGIYKGKKVNLKVLKELKKQILIKYPTLARIC